uniref:Ubiquitin-like domain-containing protein n=1 Tax=Strongyloides papillosus TaxID=174720 RepID=A0A0N5C1H8_STREA
MADIPYEELLDLPINGVQLNERNNEEQEIVILENNPEINFSNDEMDLVIESVLNRYSRTLKEMSSTVEAVLLLLELDEPVTSLERKLLWASESHIHLLKFYIRRKNELLASLGEDPSSNQQVELEARCQASVSKQLDYCVIRTTDDLTTVYQSICRIEGITVQICVNGFEVVMFPSTIALPTLSALRIKYISGKLSGILPDKLKFLWFEGSIKVSETSPLTLSGLSSLEILVVNTCSTL